ncbi:MAG: RluA family pseudouridine synthase [Bacillota bacterium]|jgi:23S rRNA pseudouridine1911/1915/1917 synthase|nr:RNA pseudouridine synthase [Bacillota bacterium]HOC06507.1 RNA pseudouridine synthase [Bacillota bacterium]HPZ22530.1 RNA pseudouridine synthase [Bacillota bacterium]HQD19813.1 RNA pseudouridine synthase [Bacillota bacterium]
MKIPVIYEDNHLLVVNKPPNILSQADKTGDEDMLTLLKRDLKQRYNKPGNVYLGLVHRLDRPVGGVMVFAKTSKAASRLSNQVRLREFSKIYLAVVHGRPQDAARLQHYLIKDRGSNKVSIAGKGTAGAKEAVLEYQLLAHKEDYSLLRINLFTGRSHQIRVQLAASGHPIFGDLRYGARVNRPGQQIALFCHELSFLHPTRKEPMTFTQVPGEAHPWNLFAPYLYEGGI